MKCWLNLQYIITYSCPVIILMHLPEGREQLQIWVNMYTTLVNGQQNIMQQLCGAVGQNLVKCSQRKYMSKSPFVKLDKVPSSLFGI
uniref:Uncharacterized protein n=1 Tax=Anguilla anguilla TaxID=7936 RepID=A0A0E9XNA8_ANGAN